MLKPSIVGVIIVGFLSVAINVAAQELSPDEFAEIQRIGEEIVKPLPSPSGVGLVAIGKSPTPFSAYLQIKHPEFLSVEIPLTGIKIYKEPDYPVLFHHFDEVLKPKLQNLKKIVVYDYVWHGNSIGKLQTILPKYLLSRGIDLEVEYVAISALSGTPTLSKTLSQRGIRELKVTNGRLSAKLNSEYFDSRAAVGTYYPTKTPDGRGMHRDRSPETIARHGQLKGEMHHWLNELEQARCHGEGFSQLMPGSL